MNKISDRKKEHLQICIEQNPIYSSKSTGFENYDFVHCAITEVDIHQIDLSSSFFNQGINYPFLISCMTGGTEEADNINCLLATVAYELNIPIGVGSQREMLKNSTNISSYKAVKKNAGNVPVISNLGAAQIVQIKDVSQIQRLIDTIGASAFVIHLNPLQELFQKEGQTNFSGLLKNIEKVVKLISIPIIVKEVGAGIDGGTAKKLLELGVQGIDVAGAGGTSWSAVEMLRNGSYEENEFWNWGLPTAYCVRTVSKLKQHYEFTLISSGGIKSGIDIAKSLALGADLTAAARVVLKKLADTNVEGVIEMINAWMNDLKKVMYLTGSSNLENLKNGKVYKKEFLT